MAGTFQERMDELAAHVGVGTLTVQVSFDQVYAHRQHEDLAFKHIHGGGAKYLERALFEGQVEYLTITADSVLDDLDRGMIEVAELLALKAAKNAPVRGAEGANVLKNSDHPIVLDNDVIVYDRPPLEPRLTQKEIVARNERLQDPHHWYGRWPPLGGRAAEEQAYKEKLRAWEEAQKRKPKVMTYAERVKAFEEKQRRRLGGR